MSLALRPTEMKCHCDRAAPMQQSAAMESIVIAAVAAAIGLCRTQATHLYALLAV